MVVLRPKYEWAPGLQILMAPAANWDNKLTSAWKSEEAWGKVTHLWDMHNSPSLRQKTIPLPQVF